MLDKTELVGDILFEGKIDFQRGGVFYSLYQAAKVNHVIAIDGYGIFKEHEKFRAFNDSKRVLDCSQNFKMIEGKKYLRC